MSGFRVQTGAARRVEEIYRYAADRWGAEQAEHYISGLFGRFEALAARDLP